MSKAIKLGVQEATSPFNLSYGEEFTAEIVLGKYIHINGKAPGKNYTNGKDRNCNKVFAIGDTVIYDSYNFYYTGTILKISPKTVTIQTDIRGVVRMKYHQFISYNWDLNLEKVEKENLETSYVI